MRTNKESNLKPIFAYFGSIQPKSIHELFVKTFGKPPERDGSVWQLKLSNGTSVVVTLKVGGVEKFREVFEGCEKSLRYFDLDQHAELLKDTSCYPKLVKELEHWLEFSTDDLELNFDLENLKDNFIDSEDGFAFDLENLKLAVRHPCGGVTDEHHGFRRQAIRAPLIPHRAVLFMITHYSCLLYTSPSPRD